MSVTRPAALGTRRDQRAWECVMRLHHLAGWLGCGVSLLSVQPALATTADLVKPVGTTAPAAPAPASPASPISTPGSAMNAAPAAASPGDLKREPDSPARPEGGSEPAAMDLATPVDPEPPKPVITLKVDIDLATQRMTVKSEDEVLHVWPISSGRLGYSTPPGTYRPQWRARMWRSRQYYGAPMPHAVFFHRGYAVHATYETGNLGRPASHGCIRLAPKNAAIFYNLVGKHGMESTQIVVRAPHRVRDEKVAANRGTGTRKPRRAPSGVARVGTPFWWAW
jgi:lipoprotein-anchoring transpeptidase ErfK/SrfK